MLCSRLHRQKVFKLKLFSYDIILSERATFVDIKPSLARIADRKIIIL